MSTNQITKARDLVQKALVWLCDRVEKGFGLARYEADEFEETKVLVGSPFEFIEVAKNRSSYLATVIADLAAFWATLNSILMSSTILKHARLFITIGKFRIQKRLSS